MMRAITLRTVAPVLLVALTLLLLAMAALGVATFSVLNREVVPALQDNARVIGEQVGKQVERAVQLGIPLDRLVGVDKVLAETRSESPGVSGLAVLNADGAPLYAVGVDPTDLAASAPPTGAGAAERPGDGIWPDLGVQLGRLAAYAGLAEAAGPGPAELVSVPMTLQGERIGEVRVAVDRHYIVRELRATAIDIAVVIGIALLLAFEALVLVISTSMTGPLAQLVRLTGRIAARDFRDQAAPVGGPIMRAPVEAANATVQRVNEAAAGLRRRLERMRASVGRGDTTGPGAVVADLERRLAAIGRFAGAEGAGRLAAAQVVGARGAAFLFVLAEELARPFLPLYFRQVTAPSGLLDPDLAIALPISVFMLVTALAGPFAAAWSDRIGRRRTFLIGAGLSTVGLAGTALAVGFADLLAWRGLSGLGYALTFVACQGHVLDRTTEADRTRGLSVFVGGILAADICGPAVGGILAEQIGYSGTLLVSAGVAALSAGLAVRMMDNRVRAAGAYSSLSAIGACCANVRFVGTVLLAAVPAKMLLTGFLFYLAPLILSGLGASDSQIGRMAMIYGISALVLMPLFASLCDRLRAHGFLVALGALLSGCGLIPFVFGASPGWVALAILALGLGHAMSISAQSALITIVGRGEIGRYGPGPVLGAFRLAERLGSAAGPLVAAQLAQAYGYVGAAATFGFASVALGTLFAALFLSIGTDPDAEPLEAQSAEAQRAEARP